MVYKDNNSYITQLQLEQQKSNSDITLQHVVIMVNMLVRNNLFDICLFRLFYYICNFGNPHNTIILLETSVSYKS